MRIGTALAPLIALFLIAPAHEAVGQNVYRDPKYGFTITFPDGWQQKTSELQFTRAKAVHRDDQNRLAMLTVAVYDDANYGDVWDMTPDQLFEKGTGKLPGVSPDLRLVSTGRTMINDSHATWLEIEIISPALAAGFFRNYFFTAQGNLIRVSYSAGGPRDWFVVNEAKSVLSVQSFRRLPEKSRPGNADIFVKPGEGIWTSIWAGALEAFIPMLLAVIILGVVQGFVARKRARTKACTCGAANSVVAKYCARCGQVIATERKCN